eukprot:scaffold144247_cov17-Tisochrysis_lutea.AAC.1
MAHLRALKHTSVSGRLMDKGALLRPCKQTKPHPLPQARLVISAMAADGSRPGGRARSPSPQGGCVAIVSHLAALGCGDLAVAGIESSLFPTCPPLIH